MKDADCITLGFELENNELTRSKARIGLCRVWTRDAIEVAKKFRFDHSLIFSLEAREVDPEPGFSHTFLRVLAEGLENYVFDGTGTGSHSPFFGKEADAPHLQDSHLDLIHYYLLNDE